MTLLEVGVTPRVLALASASASGLGSLARVTRVDRGAVVVHTETDDRVISVAKSMAVKTPPAIGDWVLVDALRGSVGALLPRTTTLVRRAAGKRDRGQVVAANLDVVLVLLGLDADYNLRRLDRYLALVGESGARPVVLLTKAGLVPDAGSRVLEVEKHAPGVEVIAVDVVLGIRAEAPAALIPIGVTAAVVGSSGVGKSTLVNHLLGSDVQGTRAVRTRDDRGVHTTSRRELFRVPGGGVVIDTPGMRELGLWGAGATLEESFPEIAEAALRCKFTDCRHAGEIGCAVEAAVREGAIDPARLVSFTTLRKELAPGDRGARDAIRRK